MEIGAEIEIIPQKFIKREFDIYKEMLDNRKGSGNTKLKSTMKGEWL